MKLNVQEPPVGAQTLLSPVGTLRIEASDRGITCVTLAAQTDNTPHRETPLTQEACRQLTAYFAGTLTQFDLPLDERGTDFEKSVWAALRTVPYGQTRTYGEIASLLCKPNAARAVGMANHKNPIVIITPCHRIIGADGALTGYALGLEMKRKLLQLEGALL